MKKVEDKLNVLQQFRSIAGVYSLTAIKGNRAEWSCSIYRGGKRIGTAQREELQTTELSHLTHYDISDPKEEVLLSEWADKAGPLGFESVVDFVEALMKYIFLLKEMRKCAQDGFLVAIDLMRLDDHNMPRLFAHSHVKANTPWLKSYQKMNPNMQVVNHQLEI
jgi:hypothetical protein